MEGADPRVLETPQKHHPLCHGLVEGGNRLFPNPSPLSRIGEHHFLASRWPIVERERERERERGRQSETSIEMQVHFINHCFYGIFSQRCSQCEKKVIFEAPTVIVHICHRRAHSSHHFLASDWLATTAPPADATYNTVALSNIQQCSTHTKRHSDYNIPYHTIPCHTMPYYVILWYT